MNEIIKFENVSFKYESEDEAVENSVISDLSLSIEKGSFVAVLGMPFIVSEEGERRDNGSDQHFGLR